MCVCACVHLLSFSYICVFICYHLFLVQECTCVHLNFEVFCACVRIFFSSNVGMCVFDYSACVHSLMSLFQCVHVCVCLQFCLNVCMCMFI